MTRNGATYVDGILIVNKTYSVAKDFNAGGGLNASALAMFNKLSEDAALHGLKIICTSGYRSYANQELIYNNYVAADGIENVIRVLEDLEDEKFSSDLEFIELNACKRVC